MTVLKWKAHAFDRKSEGGMRNSRKFEKFLEKSPIRWLVGTRWETVGRCCQCSFKNFQDKINYYICLKHNRKIFKIFLRSSMYGTGSACWWSDITDGVWLRLLFVILTSFPESEGLKKMREVLLCFPSSYRYLLRLTKKGLSSIRRSLIFVECIISHGTQIGINCITVRSTLSQHL